MRTGYDVVIGYISSPAVIEVKATAELVLVRRQVV